MKELRQVRGERGPNGDVMVLAIYRDEVMGAISEVLTHPEGPLDFANDSQGSIRLAQAVLAALSSGKPPPFTEAEVASFAENFILPADHKKLIILQQEIKAWMIKLLVEETNEVPRSVQEGSGSPV